jgi:CheY-like chemotaxis protein
MPEAQPIDRQPGLRYAAVASQLRVQIARGDYRAGDRLPGQHELARQFGVSLTTLRTAIGMLEQDGLLRSSHGIGTYVARPERRQPRAMVVDDDPQSRALLAAVLERELATVHQAGSLAQASALAAIHTFDVVFLDLMMPAGDGAETFAALRRLGVTAPVIIVTGATDADVIARAVEHGPFTLVRKPADIAHVREVFRNLFVHRPAACSTGVN